MKIGAAQMMIAKNLLSTLGVEFVAKQFMRAEAEAEFIAMMSQLEAGKVTIQGAVITSKTGEKVIAIVAVPADAKP